MYMTASLSVLKMEAFFRRHVTATHVPFTAFATLRAAVTEVLVAIAVVAGSAQIDAAAVVALGIILEASVSNLAVRTRVGAVSH